MEAWNQLVRGVNMKRHSSIVIALLSTLFVVFSCGKKEQNQVSMGYQPFGSNLAFFVAMEKGFFADEGIIVKPQKIISANDAATALINGDIVVNATMPLNVLLNIEEKEPGLIKIILMKASSRSKWSDYLLVKRNSGITSIDQLKGKKVGGYPGSAQQVLVRLILKKFSFEDKDIQLVELPPDAQLPALDNGSISALLTYDQLAHIALSSGTAEVLEENPISKHVIDPLYGFPYVISSKYVTTNPVNSEKIVRAFNRAVEFINTNETESRMIMAKWTDTDSEITARVNLWDQVVVEQIDVNALQYLADMFHDHGIISKKIDTKTLLYSPSH
jgi:NitT/TauT family transport system substrate-binding protein